MTRGTDAVCRNVLFGNDDEKKKKKKKKLTQTQRSTVTKQTEMERKRRNMRNQALQCNQLLRPIILMYSCRRQGWGKKGLQNLG